MHNCILHLKKKVLSIFSFAGAPGSNLGNTQMVLRNTQDNLHLMLGIWMEVFMVFNGTQPYYKRYLLTFCWFFYTSTSK